MTSKERVLMTFDHQEPDRIPRWCGASPEFWDKAKKELELGDEELRVRFGDDFRRVTAAYEDDSLSSENMEYKTPFGIERDGVGYGQPLSHPLSGASMRDIHEYPWPDPQNVNIANLRKEAAEHYDNYAILGGEWSPFWHDLIDLFGMEELMIKMYTEPDIVQTGIQYVSDYYFNVSQRIFSEAADLIDIFFIGNDFGSQTGSQMGDDLFRQFLLPPLKRLVDLGHDHNLLVMLHCCGGFRELIPSLIEIGIDGLHAIQPFCAGMNLQELKSEFGKEILFNGCIDSQSVLIEGDPDYVRSKTIETIEIMKPGGGFVAGASHDYILEETPVQNILTMFDTIQEHGKY
jgi:uroporphyrinogen-III decarboxylase